MARTDAPVSDCDSIVAVPPPWMTWLLPIIFVAGVAYCLHLWNDASQGARVGWDDWFKATVGLLCGPLWLFHRGRRLVLDRACLSEYRGARLHRDYSVLEITALRVEVNALKVVFGNRGTIRIPDVYLGAAGIAQSLQTMVDTRTSSPPPMDDWLPLNYLTFPPRCVSCGSNEIVAHHIFAGTHHTIPGAHVTSGFQIPVAACPRCSKRRKVVGFITRTVLIGGGVGLNVAAGLASERFPEIHWGEIDSFGVFFSIGITMLIIIVYLAANPVPRWLDRRLLGVAALRLNKEKTSVRLWFRDRQEEIEVRTLTAACRTREMANAAEVLRARERAEPRG